MERKKFIKTGSLAILGLYCCPMISAFADVPKIGNKQDTKVYLERPSLDLQQRMDQLLNWMSQNGWFDYLESVIGIKLPLEREEWLKPMSGEVLKRVQENAECMDFGGDSLLNPGFPQFSLLYHVMASPRVRPKNITAYPSIRDLDLMEDYIFSLMELPESYLDSSKYTLAVLSYEYRPAYKIPAALGLSIENPIYADFVFSRSGISRIGDEPHNYDGKMRSYNNKPKEYKKAKNIAVTPARYALFLVEVVTLEDFQTPNVALLSYEKGDKQRDFIKPVRKIVKNEDLNFVFGEYHRNEKLKRLANFKIKSNKPIDQVIISSNFNRDKAPFLRESSKDESGNTLINDGSEMVALELIGSSVLLSSVPDRFVRPAIQDGKRITFQVPAKWENTYYSNRRYGSFKLISPDSKDGSDLIITDGILRSHRRTARFGTPRNAPLFANIKYIHKQGAEIHMNENFENFDQEIINGRYQASLFEDSICDGCISVKFDYGSFGSYLSSDVLPAFSVVTAPDFFPLVDSNDIYEFYGEMRYALDEHFLEGGTSNLSWLRLYANSNILNPFSREPAFPLSQKAADTIFAISSVNQRTKRGTTEMAINFERDYSATTFLPDSASGIFYPGWDATFSGNEKDNERFFATFGLGSPFPEDMKLCAAANGMWPVTSPDAGRTFQGGLESIKVYNRKPSTSIPLMDDEIGYHQKSPYVVDFDNKASFGWDGEQGPFIQKIKQEPGKCFVNFTDIARADYVANCLDPKIGFDMSKLRMLESSEVLSRMDALRYCVRTIDRKILQSKKVQYTKYWLVNAVAVSDWKNFDADCIPMSLVGNDNNWLRGGEKLNKEGYLYIFALINNGKESIDRFDDDYSKRRIQEVKELCVCKIEKKNLCRKEERSRNNPYKMVWCSLKGNFDKINPSQIQWRNG